MKERKLNYRFHNPNSVEDTADFLYEVFLEVNSDKVEKKIQQTAIQSEEVGYIEKQI